MEGLGVDSVRVLDERVRLSQSVLWQLNRAWYTQVGPAAWRVVPSVATSTTFMARAYAEVVLCWLRDLRQLGESRAYVVEIGAGNGKFGFMVATELSELTRERAFELPSYTFVITDFVEANVAFAMRHPDMQALVGSGQLDFARFDLDEDTELRLELSGDVLAADRSAPICAFANHVLGGLPHDAFTVRRGRLCELLATIETPGTDPDPASIDGLATMTCRYDAEATPSYYYGDPPIDIVLDEYATSVQDGGFEIPVGAFRGLQRLRELAGGKLVMLAADRGYTRLDDVVGRGEPVIAMHGSLSLGVNFHAITRFAVASGGDAVCTRGVGEALNVAFVRFGPPVPRAKDAFAHRLEDRGPFELFELQRTIAPPRSIRGMLALLRLTEWDPCVFASLAEAMLGLCRGADEADRAQLAAALAKVERSLYRGIDAQDLHFSMGRVYYELGLYHDALERFERSERDIGVTPETCVNVGLCLFALGDRSGSVARFDRALELAPDYAIAAELRAQAARAS